MKRKLASLFLALYDDVVAFQGFRNRVKASSESCYIDVDGIVGNCTWACLTVYT